MSKDRELLEEYGGWFDINKNEGFTWDIVQGQVCEDLDIPAKEIKFEGLRLYN